MATMWTIPWREGFIHVHAGESGESYRAQIDTRYKLFPTLHGAKYWITTHMKPMRSEDWKAIPPKPSKRNPVLNFYAADGSLLYSATWYKNVHHAWAHVNPKAKPVVTKIAVADRKQS